MCGRKKPQRKKSERQRYFAESITAKYCVDKSSKPFRFNIKRVSALFILFDIKELKFRSGNTTVYEEGLHVDNLLKNVNTLVKMLPKGVKNMASRKNLVPQAKEALNKFKMEAASEVGVNLKEGYNGDLTSKQAGSVGGQMVKKMIQAYEDGMKN